MIIVIINARMATMAKDVTNARTTGLDFQIVNHAIATALDLSVKPATTKVNVHARLAALKEQSARSQ